MSLSLILALLLFISFTLALRSMRDFEVPKEVRKLFKVNRVRGTIMFLKEQIKHYKS